MNVFIIGGGSVGSFLCERFSATHDITVIDSDPDVGQTIDHLYDVSVIGDHACSAKVLIDAGVKQCDFFIATTNDDRSNILSCSIAKALGAKMTIARASDKTYTDHSLLNYQLHFGIDLFINPEALCALELAKEIWNPGYIAIERFSNGMIGAQQIGVSAASSLVGKTLAEIKFDPQVRIGCIYRGDHYEFATSQTTLMVGDLVTIVGSSKAVASVRDAFAPGRYISMQNVTIFGGEETAIALAKLLRDKKFNLRIIESNLRKCKALAEQFPEITIINGRATSIGLQYEEEIGSVDYFVACTKCDEDNIMSSLQASHLGAHNVMFIVNKGDYDHMLKDINYKLGIRKFVSPRIATFLELRHYLSGKKFWKISSFNDDSGYFVQLEVNPQSQCAGRAIRDIPWPAGAVVVALSHHFKTKVPSADDIVMGGDSMIIVIPKEKQLALENLLL
ncbi:MAG: Trk system potassium transporter TrkA [Puniceicoccales bacterium]|nr:Trk system potassium transporter TrkA [Puniceicoccales bacterium]